MSSFLCKKLDRFSDKSILLVRIVFGVSIALHGWEKVMGGVASWEGGRWYGLWKIYL